ncbi:MAG: amidohydrolase family protein [Actinomycetota bacterium]
MSAAATASTNAAQHSDMHSISPGLVNAHHHLYSALARGMPAPRGVATNFPQMLELVWWRLDAALDLDTIYWSAKLGALEAVLAGTTCIIDHHESPNAIEGSLDAIDRACGEVGVRVRACYGATDRWGDDGALHQKVSPLSAMTKGARRGLEECERHVRAGKRGMVGLHAAFTCSDETIAAAADMAVKLQVGVHVHVAEAVDDAQAAARLAPHATREWLIVHGVHLDRELAGRLAHNPRSNMNNGVGYAKPTTRPNTVLLGSDGIGADMLEEARLAYVRLREFDKSATPEIVAKWLDNGRDYFPEAKHDRVTWRYPQAPNPWHAAFTTGMRVERVETGSADSNSRRVVVERGTTTLVDEQEVRAKAAEAATRLHRKMEDR